MGNSFVAAKAIALLFVAIALGSCSGEHLRGEASRSSDGQTYLAIVDDNGGHCGPIKVDGQPWPYALGKAGPISPGEHTIECGISTAFSVPAGMIFKFNYWGP